MIFVLEDCWHGTFIEECTGTDIDMIARCCPDDDIVVVSY